MDNHVHLWSLAEKEPVLRHALDQPDWVYSVAFAPDGKSLACGVYDNTIRLWDLTGDEPSEKAVLQGHSSFLMSVAFAPDGKTLASASEDADVRLWDLTAKAPKELVVLRAHTAKVVAVAFSADGKALAAVCADSAVRLWKLGDGAPKPLAALKGQQAEVRAAAFSPDGKTLATGAQDDTIRLWDLSKDPPAEKVRFDGHRSGVTTMRFAKDGRTLITVSPDVTALEWRLDGDKPESRRLLRTGLRAWGLDLDRGGARLALVCREQDGRGCVRLFEIAKSDAEGFAVTTDPEPAVRQVAFSPAGETLACGKFREVELWDLSHKPARKVATLTGFRSDVDLLALSPDGRFLAGAVSHGDLKVWTLAEDAPRGLALPDSPNRDGVHSLAFSPDGKTLAVGGSKGTVQLLSVEGREVKAGVNLKGLETFVESLAFSPDGKKLAAAALNGHAVVWNAEGDKLHEWQFPGAILCVAFAPDNRHLALAHANATVSILRLSK
jgi:WD40 repeat protein